jgi:hypothetical protein
VRFPAGSGEALDQARLDWVQPDTDHDDWNRSGCALGGPCAHLVDCDYDINFATHKLRSMDRKAISSTLRKSVLDGYVLTVHVTEAQESSLKGLVCAVRLDTTVQITNPRNLLQLLRVGKMEACKKKKYE